MDRRSFLKLMAGFPFLALPLPLSQTNDELPDDTGKIAELEAQLKKLNGQFSWSLHNELRYCYAEINNEARAALHADAILAHSVMDESVLSALSNWFFSGAVKAAFDPFAAISQLLRRAHLHPEFVYLGIASTLRAGEISQAVGQFDRARALYQQALLLCQQTREPQPILQDYARLAHAKLADF